jgi:Tol biopolymer transport system component
MGTYVRPTTSNGRLTAPTGFLSTTLTTNRDGNEEVYVMNKDGTQLRNLSSYPEMESDTDW